MEVHVRLNWWVRIEEGIHFYTRCSLGCYVITLIYSLKIDPELIDNWHRCANLSITLSSHLSHIIDPKFEHVLIYEFFHDRMERGKIMDVFCSRLLPSSYLFVGGIWGLVMVAFAGIGRAGGMEFITICKSKFSDRGGKLIAVQFLNDPYIDSLLWSYFKIPQLFLLHNSLSVNMASCFLKRRRNRSLMNTRIIIYCFFCQDCGEEHS